MPIQITFGDGLPNSFYYPGQTVKGNVLIESDGEIKGNNLKIVFEGVARTFWIRGDNKRTSARQVAMSARNKFGAEYEHFNFETLIWADNAGNTLIQRSFPSGSHRFPFEFIIPHDVPPTFKGPNGFVKYSIGLVLENEKQQETKILERDIRVANHLDLNNISSAIPSTMSVVKKDSGFWPSNGPVEMKCEIPKQGFAAGEKMPINLTIENKSENRVVAIKAKLVEVSKYDGFDSVRFSHLASTCKRTIAKEKKEVNVLPNGRLCDSIVLTVPNVGISFKSSLIQVAYIVSISIKTSSLFKKFVESELKVFIGTIPIQVPPSYTAVTDQDESDSSLPNYEMAMARMQKLSVVQNDTAEDSEPIVPKLQVCGA